MDLDLLRGNKVRLTALRQDDVSKIAEWNDDVGYLRLQDTNTALPKSKAQIEAELEQLQGGDAILFAIRTNEEETLIGTVGFYEIEWANQMAWLGIGIGDRAAWGQGYGSEALRLVLQYGFEEMNLHRVTLTVVEYNERAIAMYKRAGFKHEGTFREFGRRDGKRYDMYLYGLLRSEWKSDAQEATALKPET